MQLCSHVRILVCAPAGVSHAVVQRVPHIVRKCFVKYRCIPKIASPDMLKKDYSEYDLKSFFKGKMKTKKLQRENDY